MDKKTPDIILNGMIHNSIFISKVIPFLKLEYFESLEAVIFAVIQDHYLKYDSSPSPEVIKNILSENKTLSQDLYSNTIEYINEHLIEPINTDIEWLIDTAEKYCKERSVYLALVKSIAITEGTDKKTPKTAIPELLSDALSVGFTNNIGLDYDDAEERWERLHSSTTKNPFRIKILNEITEGGSERKSLNIILASTGVGKSAFLCDLTASKLLLGKNVLYISMEMAEEKIATRIDANLLDTDFKTLKKMLKIEYFQKFNKLKKKSLGKCIIKEYPPTTASTIDFDHLIKELKQKKGFVADFIMIDYINICASSRVSLSQGSYTYVKAIAEELRSLAVRHNVDLWSATQTNREGVDASDVSLKAVSDSMGLSNTADFILALMAPEEVAVQGLILAKQLKSRYGDYNYKRKFVLGYERAKSFFFDTSLDYNIIANGGGNDGDGSDIPVFDQGKMGQTLAAERIDKSVQRLNDSSTGGINW